MSLTVIRVILMHIIVYWCLIFILDKDLDAFISEGIKHNKLGTCDSWDLLSCKITQPCLWCGHQCCTRGESLIVWSKLSIVKTGQRSNRGHTKTHLHEDILMRGSNLSHEFNLCNEY